MKEVELNAATRLIYPRLTVLVTTVNPAGEANAAPYSWVAPVSFSPPMLYLGIQRRETLTVKNIRRTKEFVVNIVTKGWAGKAISCEAKDPDKVEKSGITLRESKKVKAPTVAEAKIVLECTLKDVIETGQADHFLVIGEVVHAEKDESMKDSEIVLHKGGTSFFLPSKSIELERKK
ncbi:MAG: flavin reductase family protein [Candidatus Diapherotrites archaeon]|uniref:Flavin reductase family protein n=1 Tax=Candidatus Iainarchaeum sp. TaxID=3101447 RepID=A0A939C9V6_9ARCH|nr:flavin reductase family protein [Candidatus Diapherotrites archaeon]